MTAARSRISVVPASPVAPVTVIPRRPTTCRCPACNPLHSPEAAKAASREAKRAAFPVGGRKALTTKSGKIFRMKQPLTTPNAVTKKCPVCKGTMEVAIETAQRWLNSARDIDCRDTHPNYVPLRGLGETEPQ